MYQKRWYIDILLLEYMDTTLGLDRNELFPLTYFYIILCTIWWIQILHIGSTTERHIPVTIRFIYVWRCPLNIYDLSSMFHFVIVLSSRARHYLKLFITKNVRHITYWRHCPMSYQGTNTWNRHWRSVLSIRGPYQTIRSFSLTNAWWQWHILHRSYFI